MTPRIRKLLLCTLCLPLLATSCEQDRGSNAAPQTLNESRTPITDESSTPETTEPVSTVTPQEAVIVSQISGLRDPFLLTTEKGYYLFGTGWNGYYSAKKDLAGRWYPLTNVVEVPSDSAGDHWAPEVYEYEGAYYMFTTYKSKETGRRGCAIFRSEKPGGPYKLHSDGHVTPKAWDAIDGSLYIDQDGQPWMVFVHEWVSTDDGIGRMACAKLSKDLKIFISDPVELFRADDASWDKRGITDGCWIYRCQDGSLIMLWSNWDENGYCIGMARSPSGEILGPWEQMNERLYSKESLGNYDGGHGMLFTDDHGKLWLSLHAPNKSTAERPETPIFLPIKEENNRLVWDLEKRG